MKLFRLKSGVQEALLEWGEKLAGEYRDEALDSLREENCSRECAYIFQVGGNWYMLGHMEGGQIVASSGRQLNKTHQAILKECIAEEIQLAEVYDLKV